MLVRNTLKMKKPEQGNNLRNKVAVAKPCKIILGLEKYVLISKKPIFFCAKNCEFMNSHSSLTLQLGYKIKFSSVGMYSEFQYKLEKISSFS